MDDVKIRLSDFPGRCKDVMLVKFMVPSHLDMRTIFISLVQIYCSHENFQTMRLHENFTAGPDASKYRHLRQFWTAHFFLKNSFLFVPASNLGEGLGGFGGSGAAEKSEKSV